MKYMLALLFMMNFAHAITAPESISSETVEVGAPKDCMVLGSTDDQGEDVDQLELQKKVMDCLGPQEEVAPVETQQNKQEVVSQ